MADEKKAGSSGEEDEDRYYSDHGLWVSDASSGEKFVLPRHYTRRNQWAKAGYRLTHACVDQAPMQLRIPEGDTTEVYTVLAMPVRRYTTGTVAEQQQAIAAGLLGWSPSPTERLLGEFHPFAWLRPGDEYAVHLINGPFLRDALDAVELKNHHGHMDCNDLPGLAAIVHADLVNALEYAPRHMQRQLAERLGPVHGDFVRSLLSFGRSFSWEEDTFHDALLMLLFLELLHVHFHRSPVPNDHHLRIDIKSSVSDNVLFTVDVDRFHFGAVPLDDGFGGRIQVFAGRALVTTHYHDGSQPDTNVPCDVYLQPSVGLHVPPHTGIGAVTPLDIVLHLRRRWTLGAAVETMLRLTRAPRPTNRGITYLTPHLGDRILEAAFGKMTIDERRTLGLPASMEQLVNSIVYQPPAKRTRSQHQ